MRESKSKFIFNFVIKTQSKFVSTLSWKVKVNSFQNSKQSSFQLHEGNSIKVHFNFVMESKSKFISKF